MENLNLKKLLEKYDGFGKTYYSPFWGDVILDLEPGDSFVFKELNDYLAECPNKTLYDDGCFAPNGELAFFPSKEQRDWNVWAEEQEKIKEGQRVIKEGDYVEFVYEDLQLWGKATRLDTTTDGDRFVYIDEYCEGTKLLAHVDNDKVKKIDKFTPELLKTFDKVLVASVNKSAWYISNFGMILNNGTFECSNGAQWDCVLPYNNETSMLLHDKDAKIPDFYKY
jgi:hypothetical protein